MAESPGGQAEGAPEPREEPIASPSTPDPLERRSRPRYTALDPRGWVGWWADGDFHEVEARLLDIGELGAAVEVDDPLPHDCPLFVSLNTPSATESVQAEVVATQPGRKKKLLVRLTFTARCPAQLLKTIIHGPKTVPPPGHADPGPHVTARGDRPKSVNES